MAEILPNLLSLWDEGKQRAIRHVSEFLSSPTQKVARNWAENADASKQFARDLEEATPEQAANMTLGRGDGGLDLWGGGGPSSAMFVGAKAGMAGKTRGILDAKALELGGKAPEEIRQATGWFKGADGNWRFEIGDRGAELNSLWRQVPIGEPTHGVRLGSVLNHPELYKEYPELKNVLVKKTPAGGTEWGSFDRRNNIMSIQEGMSPSDTLDTIIHELQHGVQGIEGWARGGSPTGLFETEAAVKLADKVGGIKALGPRVNLGDISYNIYKRLAGEVEARMAEARRLMTPEQRMRVAPEPGIGQEHQIVQMPHEFSIKRDPWQEGPMAVVNPGDLENRLAASGRRPNQVFPKGNENFWQEAFDRLVASGKSPAEALDETQRLTNLMQPPLR